MILSNFDTLESLKCDVCVVGSGPVGSSLAIDLSRTGLSVLVLESGLMTPHRRIQSLSDAFLTSPHAHHQMDIAVSRSLGGTSRLWGGRCVFFDKIDFQQREYVPGSGWPISFHDLRPYFGRAAELLGCDDGPFETHDLNTARDPEVEVTNLERWVNETRSYLSLSERHLNHRVKFLLDATVVGIVIEPGGQAIKGLKVARDGRRAIFSGARFFVLALGGVETARFLLNVQSEYPGLFGGRTTTLGHNYMGHLSGSIASIRFFDPRTAHHFANIRGTRSFARRRLTLRGETQRKHQLPNISFWPYNHDPSDAQHGSGILSAISLILNIPGVAPRILSEAILRGNSGSSASVWAHLKNIIQDGRGTLGGAAEIVRQRYRDGRRLPRIFVTNPHGVYPLRFHSEQFPNTHNRISLSSELDRLGLRRALIDFKFSPDEMAGVTEAHKILDRGLRRRGLGELIYNHSEDALNPADHIQHLAHDGLHQIGVARMAKHSSAGVVDSNCRIFEFQNLFVAGSATFPTSGQASPTLPAVALAVRLCEHIAKRAKAVATPTVLTRCPGSA